MTEKLSERTEWRARYEVLQLIPAPPGLLAIGVDRSIDGDVRTFERDIVGFGVCKKIEELYYIDPTTMLWRVVENARPRISNVCEPMTLDHFDEIVPLSFEDDLRHRRILRLELNGRRYGERTHLNSRHTDKILMDGSESWSTVDNVVPPPEPDLPLTPAPSSGHSGGMDAVDSS